MSSPLEARIRKIAQEEAATLVGGDPKTVAPAKQPDRVAELEKAVSALGARVEELEKAAAAPSPAAKRTARKTAESSE